MAVKRARAFLSNLFIGKQLVHGLSKTIFTTASVCQNAMGWDRTSGLVVEKNLGFCQGQSVSGGNAS